jgi:translation initiation factor 3 subunit C
LFELSERRVHAIVSGMMLGDELKASWNQRSRTLVLHHVEPTALQTAVLRYAARVGSFLESNEALLESRFGNFAYKHDGKEGGKDEYASRDGKDGPRKFDNNKRRNDRGPPGSQQQQRRDGGEGGQGDRSYDDDDSRNRGSYRRRPYTNK